MEKRKMYYFALLGMQKALLEHCKIADEMTFDFKDENLTNVKYFKDQLDEFINLAEIYDTERSLNNEWQI
mgnify:CR=1 FL=1